MTNLVGTNLIAPIVPNTSMDIYPTHWAIYGSGGLRTVPDITSMNAIPVERRESGMQVYVVATSTVYQLSNDLSTFVPTPSSVGTLRYYPTHSSAVSDISNIPNNSFIEVEVDETHNNRITRYQNVSGTLNFITYAFPVTIRTPVEVIATSNQTVFSSLPVYVLSTSAISIYINGIYQDPSTFTETNNTTITLSSGVSSGWVISFIVLTLG